MVKGVNKRVIEINQTGNKFFEKIVIYLSPEYGDLTPAQLKRATESFSFGLRDSMGALRAPTLRKRRKLRKGRLLCALVLACLLLTGAVMLLVRIL